MKKWLFGLLPLALLGALAVYFMSRGTPGVFRGSSLPLEKLTVERTVLARDEIVLHVFNDGPDPITVSQVTVNDAFRAFAVEGGDAIERLGRARVRIPYPWNEGESLRVALVTRNGVEFETEVEAAVETPAPGGRYFGFLSLLGVYVGVVPVFLGILWLPFLRGLKKGWFGFFLAVTVGLLLFLGVDSLVEAVRIAGSVPDSLGGFGILTVGFFVSFLALSSASGMRPRNAAREGESGRELFLAYGVSIGIGVHNFGEGLAVGGAYAIGEIALGTFLVVGFMVHNVTEGIAIVAPVSRRRPTLRSLALLGAIAGAPAIPGMWIGGFAYSASWAVFFLGVGAGAIVQVVIQIGSWMGKGSLEGLLTLRNAAGIAAGLAVMYATGLLAAA